MEDLRNLRDEVLTRSAPGRAFIDLYWTMGPILARIIGNVAVLRTATLWFVVAPSAWIARGITRRMSRKVPLIAGGE